MKTKKEILINDLKNLCEAITITGGKNGYPVPEVGIGIMPKLDEFGDVEYNKAFIEGIRVTLSELGYEEKYLTLFHRKAGWDMWESKGTHLNDFIELTEEDFGDNYQLLTIEKNLKHHSDLSIYDYELLDKIIGK